MVDLLNFPLSPVLEVYDSSLSKRDLSYMIFIMQRYKAYALVGLVLTLSFLFMPKVRLDQCVTQLHWPMISLHHICDSPSLAEWAADPQHAFEDYTWRARPFYILSTSLMTSIVSPLSAIIDYFLFKHITIIAESSSHANAVRTALQLYAPYYIGMIMLNVIVLLAAWLMMMALLNMRHAGGRWAIVFALVASPISQAWFWIPTQPMMNLLVPIGAVAAFAWAPALLGSRYKRIFGLGFGLGLLVLYYAYTAIWAAALILGWVWSRRRKLGFWLREAMGISVFLIACLLPMVGWFGLFLVQGITELSSAAENYRQFVWILDALAADRFFEQVETKMSVMMINLQIVLWPWGLVALSAISILLFLRAYHPSPIKRDPLFIRHEIFSDNVIMGSLASILLMLVFQALQGLYALRSLYTILIALIIFIARLGHLFRMERVASLAIMSWSALHLVHGFLITTDAFQ